MFSFFERLPPPAAAIAPLLSLSPLSPGARQRRRDGPAAHGGPGRRLRRNFDRGRGARGGQGEGWVEKEKGGVRATGDGGPARRAQMGGAKKLTPRGGRKHERVEPSGVRRGALSRLKKKRGTPRRPTPPRGRSSSLRAQRGRRQAQAASRGPARRRVSRGLGFVWRKNVFPPAGPPPPPPIRPPRGSSIAPRTGVGAGRGAAGKGVDHVLLHPPFFTHRSRPATAARGGRRQPGRAPCGWRGPRRAWRRRRSAWFGEF